MLQLQEVESFRNHSAYVPNPYNADFFIARFLTDHGRLSVHSTWTFPDAYFTAAPNPDICSIDTDFYINANTGPVPDSCSSSDTYPNDDVICPTRHAIAGLVTGDHRSKCKSGICSQRVAGE